MKSEDDPVEFLMREDPIRYTFAVDTVEDK